MADEKRPPEELKDDVNLNLEVNGSCGESDSVAEDSNEKELLATLSENTASVQPEAIADGGLVHPATSVVVDGASTRSGAEKSGMKGGRTMVDPVDLMTSLIARIALGCFFFFVFVIGMWVAGTSLHDPDTCWLLGVGAWIVQNGAVPMTDPWSYTMGDRPFVAYQWLTELLFFASYKLFGGHGLVALTNLIVVFAFIVIPLKLFQRWKSSMWAGVAVCTLAVMAGSFHFLARPEIITYLFLSVWFVLLAVLRQSVSGTFTTCGGGAGLVGAPGSVTGGVPGSTAGPNSAGTSGSTGAPSTGTPSTGTPSTGTPGTGTPGTGTPSTGTPGTGTPTSNGTPASKGTPASTGTLGGAVNWRLAGSFAILMMFWANMHSGFVLALIVLAAFALVNTIEFAVRKLPLSVLATSWVSLILSVVATLLNPRGCGLWQYLPNQLFFTGFNKYIVELKPLGLMGLLEPTFIPTLVLSICVIVAQLWDLRRARLASKGGDTLPIGIVFSPVLTIIAFVSGTIARRMIPFSCVFLACELAWLLRGTGAAKPVRSPETPTSDEPRTAEVPASSAAGTAGSAATLDPNSSWNRSWWHQVSDKVGNLFASGRWGYYVVALSLIGVLVTSTRISAPSIPQGTTDTFYPPFMAIQFLSKLAPDGKCLNDPQYGDMMIWYLHSDVKPLFAEDPLRLSGVEKRPKVFIDTRFDMYGSALVDDYNTMAQTLPGWEERFAKYDFDWVFVPSNWKIADALRDEGWKTIFDDKFAVILSRPGSKAELKRANAEPNESGNAESNAIAMQGRAQAAVLGRAQAAVRSQAPKAVLDRAQAAVRSQAPKAVLDRTQAAMRDRTQAAMRSQAPTAMRDRTQAAMRSQTPAAIQSRPPEESTASSNAEFKASGIAEVWGNKESSSDDGQAKIGAP